MRITRIIVKCIIILVVLFLLSAAESLADWFVSVIDGDVFIGCIVGAILAIVVLSIIKPDKFN